MRWCGLPATRTEGQVGSEKAASTQQIDPRDRRGCQSKGKTDFFGGENIRITSGLTRHGIRQAT